ncbi:MAG: hypothetical protein CL678_16725 [Bdellovibrionaceae bacterium]|nr:hypothetical protein [Pseudobdellovibrionaceae bacterium]
MHFCPPHHGQLPLRVLRAARPRVALHFGCAHERPAAQPVVWADGAAAGQDSGPKVQPRPAAVCAEVADGARNHS